MTKKRFMIDDCGTLIDMKTRDTYDYVSDVVTLLNELHEENTYLKMDNRRMVKFLLSEGYTLKDYLKFIEEDKE